MTSSQDSSSPAFARTAVSDLESLAGLFHPHAIEVQEFSHYALMVDVRSQAEFDNDHIPGAVRLSPEDVPAGSATPALSSDTAGAAAGTRAPLLPALVKLVAPLQQERAVLVYCGRGGRDSLPLANALRERERTVDVLPGGWINYRRWVLAGLEILPRLISFQVVTAPLSDETACPLEGFARAGQQVLDVEALAGLRPSVIGSALAPQPAQAWFDSRLFQALRRLDVRFPVWVADTDRQLGSVTLPGAWVDAVAGAHRVAGMPPARASGAVISLC